MTDVRLDLFRNPEYRPGPAWKRALWWVYNVAFFLSPWPWPSAARRGILRLFGARIGKGVVIRSRVNIKFPWKLTVGDHAWIGEGVWIDNLGEVRIGAHACLSQGAMLLCGNHNYKRPTFDLIVGDIAVGDGAWIGAQALVAPGVTVGEEAVLSAGSVATGDLKAHWIHQGNPAQPVRERKMERP